MFIKIICFLIFFFTMVHTKRLSDAQKKAQNEHKKCREAESIPVHPLDCCKYPRFFDSTPQNLKDCDINCRMLPYPLFSCIRNCIIERYGVLTRGNGGMIGPNRITEAFYDQDEVAGIRLLPPQWRTVVFNASLDCLEEFPHSPFDEKKRNVSSEESWNYYYMNYIECIRKRNFLACALNDLPDCKKLKEAIVHCHLPNYSFLHRLFFEEFYYRNKTEEERIKKLKAANKPDLYEESHKNDMVQNPTTIFEKTATSGGSLETRGDGDPPSTQGSGDSTSENEKSTQNQLESSTSKNIEESGSTSQNSGVTGAMK